MAVNRALAPSIQEQLQTKLEKKQKDLETETENSIKLLEQICQQTTELSTKKDELTVHKQRSFQYFRREKTERLEGEIVTLETTIQEMNNEKKSKDKKREEIESEIQRDKKLIQDYRPRAVWEGYPEILDKTVFEEYAELFKEFIYPITPEEPYINIVMVGETGAGKSSLINTFATALANKKYIKDTYRISPKQTKDKEKSATKRIHLAPLYLDNEEPHLHIKFYDIPGIGEKNNVGREELDMMIDGQLKTDVEIKKASDMKQNPQNFRENPTDADKAHCILYVLKATANLSIEMSKSLKVIHDIRNGRIKEDDVRQFVIVTSIDEIGVPNDDMRSAYKYGCIRKICEKISEILDIDLPHVIPVSNYFAEVAPTTAKNAMSLMNMWRVCNSSKEFILRKRKQNSANFIT